MNISFRSKRNQAHASSCFGLLYQAKRNIVAKIYGSKIAELYKAAEGQVRNKL